MFKCKCKSTPNAVVMCGLGQVPLHVFWHNMLLKFVGQLVDLLGERLAKKAFAQAQQICTPWFRQMSGWLDAHNFQGLVSEGTFPFSNAVTTLRDTWFSEVCQSSSTKAQDYLDNMRFDSDEMAPYWHSLALFSLMKFELGSHWLKIETDKWLPLGPPRDERSCQHCHMQAVEDLEFTQALGNNRVFCVDMTKIAFASFWSTMLTKCLMLPATFTCAFMPGYPMSHIWLPTPDSLANAKQSQIEGRK